MAISRSQTSNMVKNKPTIKPPKPLPTLASKGFVNTQQTNRNNKNVYEGGNNFSVLRGFNEYIGLFLWRGFVFFVSGGNIKRKTF